MDAQGKLTLTGSNAGVNFATVNVPGGTLELNDASGSTVSRAASGTSTVTLMGGTLLYTGATLGLSTETIGTLALNKAGSIVTLNANGGDSIVTATTLAVNAATGSTALIRGSNLGSPAPPAWPTSPSWPPTSTRRPATARGRFRPPPTAAPRCPSVRT